GMESCHCHRTRPCTRKLSSRTRTRKRSVIGRIKNASECPIQASEAPVQVPFSQPTFFRPGCPLSLGVLRPLVFYQSGVTESLPPVIEFSQTKSKAPAEHRRVIKCYYAVRSP